MKSFLKIIIILLIAAVACILSFFWMLFSREGVELTNIEDYPEMLGEDGVYRHNSLGPNEIWPHEIPENAKVEKFYYEYYNPWDPNHLGYLRLIYAEYSEYKAEIDRLKQIKSSDYIGVYGIESFSKDLCTITADDYGMIYALTDEDRMEIDYVLIRFCNFFTDIKDYKTVIDSDDLPSGLDISENNARRKEFELNNPD